MIVSFKYSLPEGCPEHIIENLEDNCMLYRLVFNSPSEPKDFLPRAMLKNITEKGKMSHKQFCREWGLSVFSEKKDILTMLESIQKRGKNAYIVCGIIVQGTHGIVKTTPSSYPSHCDWFPYMGIDERKVLN